ncbi:MAG: hypothetical protein AAGF56_10110, partial [Pseudomonadota bacterium]
YLTVQRESCEVEHHFTCAADPAGHKRDVVIDRSGVTFASQIDDEAQWIASVDGVTGGNSALQPNPDDAHSLTDLLTTGVDTFDFRTFSTVEGPRRFVGTDRLTGNTVTIDGVTLDEVAVEMQMFNATGAVGLSLTSREFVSRDWRMFFSGVTTYDLPDGDVTVSRRPIEFIFPGEPGFLSSQPKHGCGVAIS